MNLNDELNADPMLAEPTKPIVETDIEAKAQTDLAEQVKQIDDQQVKSAEDSIETVKLADGVTYNKADLEYVNGNPFVKPEARAKYEQSPGYLGRDLGGLNTQVKETLSAPGSGVLDSVIGTYNLVTPGVDVPQLPEFELQGAQLARDLSSIILPGMGWARGLKAVGGVAKASSSGRLANFLKDPFVAWMGNQAANLGGGAMADLAAPVQGDVEGQTLLGSAKETFPRFFGWIPDNLVVLDGESPDSVRGKQMTEGSLLGGTGALLDGLGQLARGLKGIDNLTKYIPKNEEAARYFDTNQPKIAQTVEEAVDAPVARMNAERAELGELNTQYALRDGVDPATNPIFGKDDALFDAAENGLRSSDDMGIVGAAVDQTRIAGNIDTVYGRVRNPMSEAALKFSLGESGTVPRIIGQLGDSLRKAGEFDYRTTTGKLVKSKTLKEAQDNLSEYMLGMDRGQLGKLLSQFTVTRNGLPQLNKVGKGAITQTINKTLQQFGELTNLNNIRAMALTETAFAGQVADFATQIRLQDGRVGAFRSMEQMIDRLEFLQDIRGMSAVSKETMVRTNNTWARLTGKGFKGDEKYAQEVLKDMKGDMDSTLEALELIQADTHQFMQSLRQLAAERPNFLKPMATIYEMTDGDARSVAAANNFLRNKFGVLKKAVIDGQPEIPSAIMGNFWSQMFNSALSSVKTPLKAGVGNLSTWVYKPSSQVIGAFMNGDLRGMNRAFYAYGNTMDTVSAGSNYMKRMWVKSAQDPYVMKGRDEIVYKTNADVELLRQTADAASAEGNDGPAMLYEIVKTQDDLAKHPWLRVGNRAMGAEDAWLQAINGQQIARMRAYDRITQNGNKAFVKADADALSKDVYEQMFNTNGVMKDEQVLRETARMTFSQDNVISTGFKDIMQRIPGLRPFFMFTKTPVNMAVFDAQMDPIRAFTNKLTKFEKPFEQQPVEAVKRMLTEEGVDLNSGVDIAQEYTRLRNEYKGNHALGVSFVAMGVYGYLSGNITGRTGLRNKQKQNARRKAQDWKPMKAFGVDYSQIPGLSTWLSTTIDVLDNATEMESNDVAQMLQTQAYVLASAFSERIMLANAEQFNDVITGTGAQRWASNVAFTSQMKVAGMMGTMNQLIAPQLKAVDQRLDQLILNRVPGKPGLKDKHDWVDGGIVNEMGNPLHRLYNAFSPFPYHETPSVTKQYMTDVEYDSVPNRSTRSDGVEYTTDQIEELNRIMGEQGIFREGMKKIMKDHPASDVRNSFDTLKQENMNPSISDVDYVHNKIDALLNQAKASAELELPELQQEIRERSAKRKAERLAATSGDIAPAKRFLDDMNQNVGY